MTDYVHNPEWWRGVLEPYAAQMEIAYEQFTRRIRELDEDERLLLDDAIVRSTHRASVFASAAAILLDVAFYRVEGEERFSPERTEWALRRHECRDRSLGVSGKRHLVRKFVGEQNPRPPLREQARHASSLLLGKTLKGVTRSRRGEICIEFVDGSEVRVGATPVGLDFEIKTDATTYAEGDQPEQTIM